MLRQFHSINDPIVFQSTKTKDGLQWPQPSFSPNKRAVLNLNLRFRFFYDLSTFDPCFLLLPTAYSLGAMYFFPECKLGWVGPSDVCSIGIIRLSSFQIESVSALVWKRPVFQSWAYWRLACAHTRFSFSRRVTNTAFEGHWNPLFNPIFSFQIEEILL